MDIIDYLDEIRPEAPLTPTDPARADLCRQLVQEGKDLHRSIRYITYGWSIGNMRMMSSVVNSTRR